MHMPTAPVPALARLGVGVTGDPPICTNLPIVDPHDTAMLLKRAGAGDQAAWDDLVDRYAGLVWSVLRSYRLGAATNDDVFQTVWLRLIEHVDRIKQPERLAGWLATTTRNEALRLVNMQRRTRPSEFLGNQPDRTELQPDDMVVEADTHREVLAAFAKLGDDCRRLLELLTVDPPLEYAVVAEMLGRPVGSLGPTRARCLKKLRNLLTGQMT